MDFAQTRNRRVRNRVLTASRPREAPGPTFGRIPMVISGCRQSQNTSDRNTAAQDKTRYGRKMMRLGFHITVTCATLVLAAPLAVEAQNSQKPVATVNGEPIYDQELMSVAGPSLLELRNQEY